MNSSITCRITVDDYIAPVISLFPAAVEEAWASQPTGRAMRPEQTVLYRRHRDFGGIAVLRLA